MARINAMRDALRRQRIGLFGQEDVIKVFRKVEERMTTYTNNFESFRNRLRKYEGGRLIAYQNKVFEVNKCIGSGELEAAIGLVAEGQIIREEIDEALDAIEAYDLAKSLLKTLKLELNTKWLKQIPTVLILDKALDDADKLMLDGKHLQARVLINFCSIQADKIKVEDTDHRPISIEVIHEKIEALKSICRDTYSYSRYCPEEALEVEGKIEVMLHHFLNEGQINLVKKLIEDIDFLLKPRRSFRDRAATYHEVVKNNQAKIQQGLKRGGWYEGTNQILNEEYKRFNQVLTHTEHRLVEIQSSTN